MTHSDFDFLVQAYNKTYVSRRIFNFHNHIDVTLVWCCFRCAFALQPGVMGFALFANVTAEKRASYESFLAQQGPVIMSATIKDPLKLGAPVGNKSAYFPCMYMVHTPELFGGYGGFFQNMEGMP